MAPTWLYWPSTWTPSDLTSLRAWYDAADAATVVQSGGLISQWQDKSGGGYHLSASGAARPTFIATGGPATNQQPVLQFDGSSTVLTAPSIISGTQARTIVIVARSNQVDISGIIALTNQAPIENGRWFDVTPEIRARVLMRMDFDRALSSTSMQILVLANDVNAAIGDIGGWLDGDEMQGTPTASAQLNTGPGNTLIGRGGQTGVGHFAGLIGEVVICSTKLSDYDRQKLEGYLAHKWGLTASLPAGHPYKNSAP